MGWTRVEARRLHLDNRDDRVRRPIGYNQRVMRLTTATTSRSRPAPICLLFLIGLSLVSSASVGAQSLLPKVSPPHATVVVASSASSVTPGGALTLWADVAPYPSIHIYAAGAKDFTPVSLVVVPNAAVSIGKPAYPKSVFQIIGGSTDPVPVYNQAFRIALPATISSTAKRGAAVAVSGAVNYQACDDRLCYPVSSAPVTWTLVVK